MLYLYSKNGCKNCDIVEQMFKQYGIEYEVSKYINMSMVARKLEDTIYEDQIFDKKNFPIVIDSNNNLLLDYNEILERYEEPLLKHNPNVFSMYPITYPDIYEMYKKARASYWQPEEISLINDVKDWDSLSVDEKFFIKYILAFFSASDGIVNENIDTNLSKNVQIQEARAFYAFQEAIESVHSETYSILLDKFIKNPDEKYKLQSGIQTIPSIKKKADWCFKYMHKDVSFQKRLIAFACVEGIYFSGSFCAIFWLKKRGIMPGLSFSNELISRDEGLHTDFALLLYSKIKNKLSEKDVHEIINDAVQNEKYFIIEAIPCKLIGMNSDLMSEYIEFVADRLLVGLGYSKLYFQTNPFDFMENISLNGKTNFFERRVGEYAKASVMVNKEDSDFGLDADF
jgi:ribonucleotide reductase beta subunit family protein with ferritin-like domain